MKDCMVAFSHVTRRFPAASGRRGEWFTAVDDVSFELYEGEILGLLGESGCGKSTLARMLMGLIPPTEGEIRYRGRVVSGMAEREFRPLRREIQMVFQNPFGCLDPQMKVERLLMEPLRLWRIGGDDAGRRALVREMLDECGLPPESLGKRPGEFSGGQLQRIAIARALLVRPKLLVADEIVSALDVSVQGQILQLLLDMRRRYGLSMLFITHDLAVMARMADRVMVMQGGKIRQTGDCREVMDAPTDPYMKALKASGYWL